MYSDSYHKNDGYLDFDSTSILWTCLWGSRRQTFSQHCYQCFDGGLAYADCNDYDKPPFL